MFPQSVLEVHEGRAVRLDSNMALTRARTAARAQEAFAEPGVDGCGRWVCGVLWGVDIRQLGKSYLVGDTVWTME